MKDSCFKQRYYSLGETVVRFMAAAAEADDAIARRSILGTTVKLEQIATNQRAVLPDAFVTAWFDCFLISRIRPLFSHICLVAVVVHPCSSQLCPQHGLYRSGYCIHSNFDSATGQYVFSMPISLHRVLY